MATERALDLKAGAFGFVLLLTFSATAAFTQLESITADGHVWIYSGVKPTCADRVEITFKAVSGSTATLYCSDNDVDEHVHRVHHQEWRQ